MRHTFYEIATHLGQWIFAGTAWKDYGFTMPVGMLAVVEAAEHALTDGIAQDITQWGGATLIILTIFIKIWNFVKKTDK